MTKKKDTLNKMAGTSWHVGYLHKKESDPRRHQSRCRYYNKKKGEKAVCAKNFGNCHGSSQCPYYDEGPDDYTYNAGLRDKGTPVISTIPFKGVKQIPIDKIEVSANAAFPKRENILKALSYYSKNKKFENPIQVICKDDKYQLAGNAATYHAAKMIKVKTVDAVMHDSDLKSLYKSGAKVKHNSYGNGTVRSWDRNLISIEFSDGTVRQFDLDFCLKKKIITLI